jgi:hypothetical protein
MAKRHQASRRKAYGRRQHELRERFDRGALRLEHPLVVEVYDTEAYDDSLDSFPTFDLAVAGATRFVFRD